MPAIRRKRSVVAKRPAPYKKPTVPVAVKSYVKRAVGQTQEKKEFVYSVTSGVTKGVVISYNINYHAAAHGTGETKFVGNRYKVKSIHAQFDLTNSNPSTRAIQPVTWILGIVKTNVYKTTTSLTNDELFDGNYTLLANTCDYFRDSDKCKWLAKKTVTIYPNQADPTESMTKKASVYASKDMTFAFRDFDVNYEGKNGNLYVVALPLIPFDTRDVATCFMSMALRLTFSDS